MSVKVNQVALGDGDSIIVTKNGSKKIAVVAQNVNDNLYVGGPIIKKRCMNFRVTEKRMEEIKGPLIGSTLIR